MKTIELKPCPFCDGEAKLTEHFGPYDGAPFRITCQKCGARITDFEREEAVAAWNRRVRNIGQGDCVRCPHDPDTSCPYCGEPDGCNNRMLAELARKVAEK